MDAEVRYTPLGFIAKLANGDLLGPFSDKEKMCRAIERTRLFSSRLRAIPKRPMHSSASGKSWLADLRNATKNSQAELLRHWEEADSLDRCAITAYLVARGERFPQEHPRT